MRKRLVIAVSGSVLALAACSGRQDSANNDANIAMDNGAVADSSADAGSPAPTTAQGFVNAAAASDKFEIESSRLAVASAGSAAVKRFAQQMISAHEQSTAKLKTTLAGQSPAVTPDDTLTADQQAALGSLKGEKGAEFDSAYAAAQVDAHQKALDLLKSYSASGDNPALKNFADGLIPTVTAHLNMAKGLK